MADWPTIPARQGIVQLWQPEATKPARQVLLLRLCDPNYCWVVRPIGQRLVAECHARQADLRGACSKCGTFHTTEGPEAVVACAEAQDAEYDADQSYLRTERLRDEAGL